MSTPASVRPYGGVNADQRALERRERLLEAGLDLLGSADESVTLTVRGVCARAGVVARYFYEAFADSDALAVEVYERVNQNLVTDTLSAMAASAHEEQEQIRTGLSAIVAHLVADPRRGRLIFGTALSHPALAPKRLEMARMFAGLLATQAESFYQTERTARLDAIARFLVGGFGETLMAWQHGDLDVTQQELVDLCVALFASSAASVRD